MNSWTLLAAFSCLVASAVAFPYPYPMPMPVAFPDDSYHKPHHDSYGHDIGRVKIQVYRGPDTKKCYGYECFAPWGYYETQPHDKVYRGPSEYKDKYNSFAPWGYYATQPKDAVHKGYH
ncbi:hypothetical protein TCAL_07656 [Tigriopus californicus]|uniref:Uncharacterized protein n=1 Tax=Tigriopus californicus TaxID=6832 RepID=A0A553NNB4_TIGCA|nr:hypothetical protein TCAL_07656 [Tigriopus californicus]